MYYILRLDVANAASGLAVDIVGNCYHIREAKTKADKLTRANPTFTHVVVLSSYTSDIQKLLAQDELNSNK